MDVNDFLFIEQMEVRCLIGTTPEERSFPQVILIDLKAWLPLAKAGRSDNLNESIDYTHFINVIKQTAASKSFKLVEAFIESIADELLASHPIHSVEIKARKKVFDGIAAVGASICRTRKQL